LGEAEKLKVASNEVADLTGLKMTIQRVLIGALLVVLGVMLCREVVSADGMCGLRPPASETHPSDMNADGETTPEEFAEYAKVGASCIPKIRTFLR
jgi:hypothetical protein